MLLLVIYPCVHYDYVRVFCRNNKSTTLISTNVMGVSVGKTILDSYSKKNGSIKKQLFGVASHLTLYFRRKRIQFFVFGSINRSGICSILKFHFLQILKKYCGKFVNSSLEISHRKFLKLGILGKSNKWVDIMSYLILCSSYDVSLRTNIGV